MMATRALQAMKVEGAPLYDSNLSSVTGIAVGADLLDKPLAKTGNIQINHPNASAAILFHAVA